MGDARGHPQRRPQIQEQRPRAPRQYVLQSPSDLRADGPDYFVGRARQLAVQRLGVLPEFQPAAAATAPLLCAGITAYSPLRYWQAGPGKKVGIVGLGGLGHMGVKIAHALGAHVVLFTTSPGKVEDGRRLGANEVVVSKDANAVAKHLGSFDFILDCVSASHDINAYLSLLKVDGALTIVGAPEQPLPVSVFSLIMARRSFGGSLIGGLPETQEMLDFCAEKGIASDIETIAIQQIDEAYERPLKSDVKYRFVIDMASLKK